MITKKIFAVIFVLLMCGVSFGASNDIAADGGVATKSDIQELKSDIRLMLAKIDAMNTRLNDFQTYTAGKFNDMQTYTAGQFSAVNQRIDNLQASMNDKFSAVNQRIDDLQVSMNDKFSAVNQRIDDLQGSMNDKFAAVHQRIDILQNNNDRRLDDFQNHMNNRIDDLKTFIYWGLSILALIIGGPMYAPKVKEFLKNMRVPKMKRIASPKKRSV